MFLAERIVIAGAGHAAGQLVTSLKQQKFAGQIILIGDEPYLPYQRPPLSKKFLSGDLLTERLYVKPPAFYDDPQIEQHLGVCVTSIDRDGKSLQTDNGGDIAYDKLILSLGSRARRLAIEGSDLDGVHYLRNIADVSGIQSELGGKKNVVIVGAGYIGLEVAAVTRQLGHDVTVVEMADRVMSRVVSPEISDFYQIEHASHGVKLRLSAHPNTIYGRQIRLESVHNALEQARTVVGNICGKEMHYSQVPWFWSDQYDLKLQIAGLSEGYDSSLIRGNPADRSFACLYLKDNRLIATDAVNSAKEFVQSKILIASRTIVDRDKLADKEVELKELVE